MVANKLISSSPRNAFKPIICSKTAIIPRTFYSSLCNYYTFSKPVWTNDWNTEFWFVLLLVITHFHQWLWRVKNLLDERERMEWWNGCIQGVRYPAHWKWLQSWVCKSHQPLATYTTDLESCPVQKTQLTNWIIQSRLQWANLRIWLQNERETRPPKLCDLVQLWVPQFITGLASWHLFGRTGYPPHFIDIIVELRRPSTTGYMLAQEFAELLGQAMTACSHMSPMK